MINFDCWFTRSHYAGPGHICVAAGTFFFCFLLGLTYRPITRSDLICLFIYFIVIIHKRYKIVYVNIYKDTIVTVII